MRKTSLLGAAVASLALMAGIAGYAQTYSNAVQALNPVAYWPLTETAQPPVGQYVANNLGTLGTVGNGYYETWWQATASSPVLFNTNNIQHVPGVTGDSDMAMQDGGVGQYVVFPRFTNGVANSALTITAPFSIELWAKTYTTNVGLAPMVTEGRN
ncbi:MAG TPA: hypothetical protein VNZ22_19760, partial [Bacillota bacterium]|nr:hypothetical protein [Bacillota bacterium]